MKPLKFHCYALEKDGIYVAGCITLNLLVHEDSLKGALDQLELLIDDHLSIVEDYIEKLDRKEHYKIKPLLNRPAPLFMYIDFFKCFIYYHMHSAKEILTFSDVKFISNLT